MVDLSVEKVWKLEDGRGIVEKENDDEMEKGIDRDVDVVVDEGKEKKRRKKEMKTNDASKQQRQCLRNCWIESGRQSDGHWRDKLVHPQ